MNTYKEPESDVNATPPMEEEQKANTKRSKGKFGSAINQLLNGEFLAKEGLVNHLPFISFLVGLFVLHIALMYYFENTQRSIHNSQHQLNELNASYKTTLSQLEIHQQQSHVAADIEAIGLYELRTPPNIIDVAPDFFNSEKQTND